MPIRPLSVLHAYSSAAREQQAGIATLLEQMKNDTAIKQANIDAASRDLRTKTEAKIAAAQNQVAQQAVANATRQTTANISSQALADQMQKLNITAATKKMPVVDAQVSEALRQIGRNPKIEATEEENRRIEILSRMPGGMELLKNSFPHLFQSKENSGTPTNPGLISILNNSPTSVARPTFGNYNPLYSPGLPTAEQEALSEPIISPDLIAGGVAGVGRKLVTRGASVIGSSAASTAAKPTSYPFISTLPRLGPSQIVRQTGYANTPWRPF